MHILELIQEIYGPRNTPAEVFFPGDGEAVIFINANDGSSPMMVNLSTLSDWRADGTIATEEELKRKSLRIV